jgi:anti-anti-sigma factor
VTGYPGCDWRDLGFLANGRKDAIMVDVSDDFSVTVTDLDSGQVLIVVLGELDLATAEDLWALTEPRLIADALVVLDAAKIPFMDSSGLRVLLQAARKAEKIGARFRVAAVTPPVARMLDVAGTSAQVDVRDDVADAFTR